MTSGVVNNNRVQLYSWRHMGFDDGVLGCPQSDLCLRVTSDVLDVAEGCHFPGHQPVFLSVVAR